LPELIGAAGSLLEAMPIIEAEILKQGVERKSVGKVVIGSVAGDIHNIGKSMVSSLLTAAGFTVQDLGIDVSTETFVKSVKELQPDILAMSALLTTTAPEGRKVIEALKEAGIRDEVKVMIGGGAITADFAESIGADGYDSTAPGAVKVATDILEH
jgi:methanogenic corrinoid protein MtbC1